MISNKLTITLTSHKFLLVVDSLLTLYTRYAILL